VRAPRTGDSRRKKIWGTQGKTHPSGKRADSTPGVYLGSQERGSWAGLKLQVPEKKGLTKEGRGCKLNLEEMKTMGRNRDNTCGHIADCGELNRHSERGTGKEWAGFV